MGKLVSRQQTQSGGAGRQGRRAHRRVAMQGRMTIYEAAEHKRALLEALGRSAELEIDLSEVSELDTAGIQLLALAKREAARAGKAVRLTAHSPATLEVIDLFSLGSFFGDPLVISRKP